MPAVQRALMEKLYGHDVWEGFQPSDVGKEVQGWNGNHVSLQRLSTVPGVKVVVDVGVWKGQSTITMAKAMKQQGIDGCVLAVDTFLGSPEHWDRNRHLFRRKNGLPDLYLTFMSNVYTAGVQDYVIPIPQTSITAAMIFAKHGVKASVVHIDAAHEYEEVLRDAEEYWKLLEPGGFLIGDDYDPTWMGVVRAVGEFSAKHSVALRVDAPKWIARKPE